MFTFYEFFAGGGMARLGLGPRWKCLFANDFDPKKAVSYRANFSGGHELKVKDVAKIASTELPDRADLVWASFPCQDLSLAGDGAGLNGARSGAFWPFWKLIRKLISEGRKPSIIALENVCGALTSHGGRDFAAIGNALSNAGYKFGAIVLDAVDFVPQSRPRLFIVGVSKEILIPRRVISAEPIDQLHPSSLQFVYRVLSPKAASNWVWWKLPKPRSRQCSFSDLIEENPKDVAWASAQEIDNLLGLMSPLNLAKVHKAQLTRRRAVGGIYRRTRLDVSGNKVQRAEIRFDDVAGCLRTPAGGSSRQRVLIVDKNQIRARLLSSREAARLMGLPDTYILPERYNDAYHLAGDGVVVPVVRWLATNLLEPLALSAQQNIALMAAE